MANVPNQNQALIDALFVVIDPNQTAQVTAIVNGIKTSNTIPKYMLLLRKSIRPHP